MSASNCPETPRQKMIQMMYLVYTAMLALNVSAEVVNGFKSVGNAMTKSNQNMEVKLQDTYDNFDLALKNNHDKVIDKYEKAQQVKTLSRDLANFCDSITYTFIGHIASSAEIPQFDENGKKLKPIKINLKNEDKTTNIDSVKRAVELGGFSWIQKLDDNHAGTPFFVGKAEGEEATEGAAVELKNKIIDYKQKVYNILGADSTHVQLGLNVEGKEFDQDGKLKSWEMLNFNETVAGAALVTMVRMKAEVMNAEFDAVNMLYKQVKSNDFSFDKVAVVTRPSSSYIMQGGKYELVVNVGAYDSKAKFEATIGGSHFTANDSGAVVYTTTCGSTGMKTVAGTVYVKNDNGTESYDFKQSYYVAEPMVVAELTEMNVVYSGIENPVKVSVPGTAAHDLVVTLADPSQGTIVPDKEKGAGFYRITPKVRNGKLVLNTSIKDGKATRFMGTREFRVRTIPSPTIYLGGKYESGKSIPIGEFKNLKGISVKYGADFAFHMKLPTVSKQNVTILKVPGADDMENKGPNWNPEILSYVAKAKPGCKITIDANVSLPDGTTKTVTGSFRIAK